MEDGLTLPFDTFWTWLMTHPNCILRAGTPETVLYDDDDLHWQFVSEDPATLVVQMLRGKRLVGELLLGPEQIEYVQEAAGEQEGEVVFELISKADSESFAAYFFVLVHGYHNGGSSSQDRVH